MADNKKMTRDQFAAFANPSPKKAPADVRNAQYYLQYWTYFADDKWFRSWNWPAFFLGPLWFFYRRMYVYGVVAAFFVAICETVALVVTGAWIDIFSGMLAGIEMGPYAFFGACFVMMVPAFILSTGSRALVALYANALYFNHTVWWRGRKPAAKGGVNLWCPIIVAVLVFGTLFALGFYQGYAGAMEAQAAAEASTLEGHPLHLLPEGGAAPASEPTA